MKRSLVSSLSILIALLLLPLHAKAQASWDHEFSFSLVDTSGAMLSPADLLEQGYSIYSTWNGHYSQAELFSYDTVGKLYRYREHTITPLIDLVILKGTDTMFIRTIEDVILDSILFMPGYFVAPAGNACRTCRDQQEAWERLRATDKEIREIDNAGANNWRERIDEAGPLLLP